MILPSKQLLTLALAMPLVAATGARAQEHEKADLDDRFDFLHTLRNPGHFEIDHIRHVIVIYQENWSFDGLYSSFPGADGFPDGTPVTQLDRTTGAALSSVPQPVNGGPDHRFPGPLPVAFYDLSHFVTNDQLTGDIIHRYYHEQLQIANGTMSDFVTWSDNGGLVLSHFDATGLPEGHLARRYVMADHCFHSAFGGSFLNHQWLIAAQTPSWNGTPPASFISQPLPASIPTGVDPATLLKDSQLTPLIDGQYFCINTIFTHNTPHPASVPAANLAPDFTNPTIGDRLSAAGKDWAWYSGGWNNAIAGHPDPLFQFHHQPFAFYRNYADGTPGRAAHLKDEQDFLVALSDHALPSVSFIKPLGPDNEHPGYAALQRGQQHVADLVSAVQASPYWHDTAIFITYDENGGRWDHVPVPKGDAWGPGTRVPLIIISPWAKRHFVDHIPCETVSILRFIEKRWHLAPLGERDAKANDLTNAFTNLPFPWGDG